ncbi:hypothetical protein BX54_00325 [Escherichia coli O121:H19 str. 2010C-3840]|nr:hypothetical protein BX62_04830 [Escherichia coli O121:H19 str. 2010C-4254]EYV03068.1 hypothetical protein BX54_00325 [Escherichia coli O121:H19 str. 2010C-3840]EYV07621.1 hypothetical protein BX52_19350 [Escherichia coli O121:H19 str. 2010C-3609]EYV75197.1 hypothetical protein BX25_22740 [Escherichia coli O121:H19 str. 2009C-4659]EYV77455.1 hypothetical protein BX32_09270 [Escherichia coli O121:H19 str. 2009EL1412]EYX93295.1 hypothetical protein BY02_24300 [Escherichia coli O121:H19 str. 2
MLRKRTVLFIFSHCQLASVSTHSSWFQRAVWVLQPSALSLVSMFSSITAKLFLQNLPDMCQWSRTPHSVTESWLLSPLRLPLQPAP